ncbi:hypothetical protein AVEN_126598-1 [Araneus ventricosus]|uniref:Uncharacterized protein n=1 Tax=Araneus ventricosus TaxID=182803 RepID=A0A4Y2RAH6_ARAVE|nr:hypothetical protein AVEN_126598-1 [Araneus ventricosus]
MIPPGNFCSLTMSIREDWTLIYQPWGKYLLIGRQNSDLEPIVLISLLSQADKSEFHPLLQNDTKIPLYFVETDSKSPGNSTLIQTENSDNLLAEDFLMCKCSLKIPSFEVPIVQTITQSHFLLINQYVMDIFNDFLSSNLNRLP